MQHTKSLKFCFVGTPTKSIMGVLLQVLGLGAFDFLHLKGSVGPQITRPITWGQGWERATQLLQSHQGTTLRPDEVTLSACLAACCHLGYRLKVSGVKGIGKFGTFLTWKPYHFQISSLLYSLLVFGKNRWFLVSSTTAKQTHSVFIRKMTGNRELLSHFPGDIVSPVDGAFP